MAKFNDFEDVLHDISGVVDSDSHGNFNKKLRPLYDSVGVQVNESFIRTLILPLLSLMSGGYQPTILDGSNPDIQYLLTQAKQELQNAQTQYPLLVSGQKDAGKLVSEIQKQVRAASLTIDQVWDTRRHISQQNEDLNNLRFEADEERKEKEENRLNSVISRSQRKLEKLQDRYASRCDSLHSPLGIEDLVGYVHELQQEFEVYFGQIAQGLNYFSQAFKGTLSAYKAEMEKELSQLEGFITKNYGLDIKNKGKNSFNAQKNYRPLAMQLAVLRGIDQRFIPSNPQITTLEMIDDESVVEANDIMDLLINIGDKDMNKSVKSLDKLMKLIEKKDSRIGNLYVDGRLQNIYEVLKHARESLYPEYLEHVKRVEELDKEVDSVIEIFPKKEEQLETYRMEQTQAQRNFQIGGTDAFNNFSSPNDISEMVKQFGDRSVRYIRSSIDYSFRDGQYKVIQPLLDLNTDTRNLASTAASVSYGRYYSFLAVAISDISKRYEEKSRQLHERNQDIAKSLFDS